MMQEVSRENNLNLRMFFSRNPENLARYNPARVSEVAAIFNGVDGQAPSAEASDFVIYPRQEIQALEIDGQLRNNNLITIKRQVHTAILWYIHFFFRWTREDGAVI